MPKLIHKCFTIPKSEKAKEYICHHHMKGAIYHELGILSQLDYPSIIKYYESFEDDQEIKGILEYSPGRQLDEISQTLPRGCCKEKLTIFYLIWKTVNYLTNKNFIHRDLKPQNIMVIEDENLELGFSIKLIDFGLCKSNDKDHAIVGSPLYMSPEAFKK